MRLDKITPEMRRLMNPEDAARFCNKMLPQKSPGEPTIPRLERDEHRIFENWLLSHNYAYRHSRTDKATRETCGAPDFSVYDKCQNGTPVGYCLAIEFKIPGNKLSKVQEDWAAKYGATVHIIATAAEAILLVLREFGA